MQRFISTPRRQYALLALVALVVAAVGARPYAGGWNDGTRLATIEALVDYGSFAIEDSIFVKVPADGRPYPESDPMLQKSGTLDKLLIDGHYYTDKPPVPAVLSAAVYWVLQRTTGLSARDDTAIFCRAMNFIGAGLAFVVAVLCWRRIASQVGLADRSRGFALGSRQKSGETARRSGSVKPVIH